MAREITNEDLMFNDEEVRYNLPKQQRAVIRLLCQGKNNSEIAETLNISYKTVKSHITVIYRKLGVKTRSQAILKWLKLEAGLNESPKVKELEQIIAEKDREIDHLKDIICDLVKKTR